MDLSIAVLEMKIEVIVLFPSAKSYCSRATSGTRFFIRNWFICN